MPRANVATNFVGFFRVLSLSALCIRVLASPLGKGGSPFFYIHCVSTCIDQLGGGGTCIDQLGGGGGPVLINWGGGPVLINWGGGGTCIDQLGGGTCIDQLGGGGDLY